MHTQEGLNKHVRCVLDKNFIHEVKITLLGK